MNVDHTIGRVSRLRRYTFWIDETHAAALKRLKDTPGEEANESAHVRQAVREYLERKGLTRKAASRRARTRRKA
jgi:hypothetical protein